MDYLQRSIWCADLFVCVCVRARVRARSYVGECEPTCVLACELTSWRASLRACMCARARARVRVYLCVLVLGSGRSVD